VALPTSVPSNADVEFVITVVSLTTSVEVIGDETGAYASVSLVTTASKLSEFPEVEFIEIVSSLSIVEFVTEVSSFVTDTMGDNSQHKPSPCFKAKHVLLSLSLSATASFN